MEVVVKCVAFVNISFKAHVKVYNDHIPLKKVGHKSSLIVN